MLWLGAVHLCFKFDGDDLTIKSGIVNLALDNPQTPNVPFVRTTESDVAMVTLTFGKRNVVASTGV